MLVFSPRRPFSEAAVLIVQNKDSAADYWVQNISDYSVLTLPRLAEEESSDTTHLASLTLEPSSAEILDGCMALGVTLQSVLLLAWGKVLSTLVGRRDVVFGQVVSGRTLPLEGVEGISGPLFNTVPMRIQLAQNLQDNRSLVAQIQRKSAESQSHQHASLRTIQNKWRAASGSTAGSLFDTLFVFQKAMVDEQEDGDRIWSPIDGDEGEVQAEYPFNLEIVQTPKTILLQAAAQGAYLSADGLRNALSQLSGAILDIIQNPSRLATAFPEGLHALPLAISNDEAADESSRTDFNPDEAAIREIISEIASMPIEKITLRESIYAYGIDSISAIRVASACRKRGIQLGVADILQGGHIEGICQRFLKLQASRVAKAPTVKIELVSAAEKTKALSILNIAEETVEKILPVLAGQLFHLDGWLKCGRTFYEPTWTFEARERLDLERLQVCWQALRYRHPILRTVFAAVSPDKAVQVMLKSSTVTESHGWNFRETETDASSAVMKEVYDISRLPADLFTPPVRLTIIRGSDFDGVLFTFHHAVYDAWSMPTMIADLFALYTGSPVESNTGFADFVEFSHTSRSIPDEQQYWSNSLSAAETTLITPSTKPPAPSDGSMQQTFVLAPRVAENFSALDQTCKKAGVMLSSLVLAAFSRALAAKTGTLNPTFGIYQVGRSASFDSLETVAGPCLNLTPVTVPAKLTPQEAALAIQSELGSRVAYEQTPLRDILAWKESKLEFNTFVNLLWHTEKMVEDPKAILKHLKIGVPTDYCSNEPLHGVTSVDALDNGYFPIQGVYLDVGPNLDTDTIDFGVRCDKVLMGDDELREFIAAIGEQIVDAVATLI